MSINNNIKTDMHESFEMFGKTYEIDINRVLYFDEIGEQGAHLSDLIEDKYIDNIPFNIAVNRALYRLRNKAN